MKIDFVRYALTNLIVFGVVVNITSSTTNFSFDAIDGGWSPWSKLVTTCHVKGKENQVVDCGGGVRKRYRSCTHPVPQGNGRDCADREDWGSEGRKAVDNEYPCNTHSCRLPGDLLWSEWSSCTKSCGKGVVKRHTMCGVVRKRAKPILMSSTTSSSITSSSTSAFEKSTSHSEDGTTTSTLKLTKTTSTVKGPTRSTISKTSHLPNESESTTFTSNYDNITSQISTTDQVTPSYVSSTPEADTDNPNRIESIELDYELQYIEPCQRNQYREELKSCNTWSRTTCNSPCKTARCPTFAKCVDISNASDALFECKCQLGTEMKDDRGECIVPQRHDPTPRPHPSMSPGQKTAAVVLTRGASTILIIFLLTTLVIFAVARIFDSSRMIHMNMEIALLFAHFFLLPSIHDKSEDACTLISIFIHFFFTACFVFMLLEAIHMYSLVAWVVRSDGLLSPLQNTVFGWTTAFTIVLYNMCFGYEYYGGSYHCWLRMNTPLIYGQYIPIVFITIVTFAIIEAAGDVDVYTKLDNVHEEQRTTAKVIQRTLLLVLPMVFTSFILGTLAEFEQNIYLYSVFTLVNGILGAVIFSFHTSANATVRAKIKGYFCRKQMAN